MMTISDAPTDTVEGPEITIIDLPEE